MNAVQVTDLHLDSDAQMLRVRFGDGVVAALPVELLRVESPSAEVQGHGPGERQLVAGKSLVRLIGIEPVGNYAVRLVFDDGHDTGIFSWAWLRRLHDEQDALWAGYLAALAAAGRRR